MNDPELLPADAPCAEAEDDEELCGTTTFHEPASPSVAFTCVWLVSDWRVTVAVPVLYPAGLPAPGEECEPRMPPASTAPTAAATSTTATPVTSQRRAGCGPGPSACPPGGTRPGPSALLPLAGCGDGAAPAA